MASSRAGGVGCVFHEFQPHMRRARQRTQTHSQPQRLCQRCIEDRDVLHFLKKNIVSHVLRRRYFWFAEPWLISLYFASFLWPPLSGVLQQTVPCDSQALLPRVYTRARRKTDLCDHCRVQAKKIQPRAHPFLFPAADGMQNACPAQLLRRARYKTLFSNHYLL